MNDQNPETPVSTPSKPSLFDRARGRGADAAATPKPKTTVRQKAKTVAAVVGVVAVAGYVAGKVAQKKSASVSLTLPDVDVTTTDDTTS